MEKIVLDRIDKEILDLLQKDADTSLQTISEAVNLSTTPCWRRVQRLQRSGYILRKVALLDAPRLNVGVTVFISIRTNQHNDTWTCKFKAVVDAMPEIVEFYRMSGDVDYLLRVVVPDIRAYDLVYQQLIKSIELTDVSSSFAMEQIKYTTALPLNYA